MNEVKENKSDRTRRDFLKFFFLGGFVTWVVSFLYIVIRFFTFVKKDYVDSVSEVVIDKIVKDFRKNSSIIFPFGNRPGLLIRKKDGKFTAYFATCTHLGCTVQYDPSSEKIVCACHMGIFDVNGKNIEGPPPNPLESLRVQIDQKRRIHVKLHKG